MKFYLKWTDKGGERYWYAAQVYQTLDENGRRIRKERWHSLHVKGKNKRRAAERAIHDLEMELRSGKWREEQPISVKVFTESYLSAVRMSLRPKTWEMYRHWLSSFASMNLHMRLAELTPVFVERWKLQLSQSYSPTSVNIALRSLKAALNHAVRQGLIERSPMVGVRMVQVPKRTFPPFITMEQFKTLVLPEVKDQRHRVAFCLAMLAGLRRREIAYLRWDQIDFERGEIRIESNEAFQTKSGHGRVVPLYATLRAELEKLPRAANEYVLRSKNRIPDDHAFSHAWLKVRRKLNGAIPPIPLHGLRHSFATWLAGDVGLNLKAIQAILGHGDIQTTMLYAHIQPQLAIEQAKRVDV